ncbi:MAG: TRAP transporter small permease [Oscillospiraceae bacterium]|nr:TRAP transporter small permease [Oscillospiraceae bacterium]
MKKKITFKGVITNLDAIITGTTLTICVFLVNANVIMRYFLNNPIRWSEEVVTSLFVWTVFIGSAYAYRKHSHLGVDIVVNLIPGKAKHYVRGAVRIMELLVLIMLTVISAQYVYHLIYSRTGALKIVLTEMLRVPKWWTGIAVPTGFGLSVIYSVYFMIKDAMELFGAKKSKEGGAE